MNEQVIKNISSELNITTKQVIAVLDLLSSGATIPFIARYRKEVTGNLDETIIKSIEEVYAYQVNLAKRKEDIIRLIDEKGLLTEELVTSINNATKLIDIEDIYRPFKEKKKTKATIAIAKGLEPLAKLIMTFPDVSSIDQLASKYLNDQVLTIEDAINGAKDIIAEWISDNANYRKRIRQISYVTGNLVTKEKKQHADLKEVYKIYYNFISPLNRLKSYQVLAINRAENEKVISASIEVDTQQIITFLENNIIKKQCLVTGIIQDAILDSYKRLIAPSIERELRSDLKEQAEIAAINVFAANTEKLLLTPPIKQKIILGFDPAFRTGCKLAVLGKNGEFIAKSVIYPHPPVNKVAEAEKTIIELVNKYRIDIIAIGNGTASRESEQFIAGVIKNNNLNCQYVIVSEAGASVYSASKEAISEFPDLQVEQRSAISIGRRLQDALSELVKIDPKSIGVGQYQHDVNQTKLNEHLAFTVSKVVNNIGININTASSALLKYISGMNKTYINKITNSINSGHQFTSRTELAKILSPKVYEQAIGFLRVYGGSNILDSTDIHPESYHHVLNLLKHLNLSIDDINQDEFKKSINDINVEELSKVLNIDKYTLEGIKTSLLKPGRDIRDTYETPLLRSDILSIEDLKVGLKLTGTVRNVADFGAFVDIGLKNDGLIHISKLSNQFVKDPKSIVSVGDILEVTVIDIDVEKQKVGLSLI